MEAEASKDEGKLAISVHVNSALYACFLSPSSCKLPISLNVMGK